MHLHFLAVHVDVFNVEKITYFGLRFSFVMIFFTYLYIRQLPKGHSHQTVMNIALMNYFLTIISNFFLLKNI